MFDFVKYRRYYFLFSAFLIIAGVIAMIISVSTYPERSPVRLSVDFVGGSLFTAEFRPPEGGEIVDTISSGDVAAIFSNAGLQDVRVQALTGLTEQAAPRFQVRTNFVNDTALVSSIADQLETLAQQRAMVFARQEFLDNQEAVSPIVGGEVTRAALVATIVASLLVLGFIATAFRQVAHSFRYGVTAVLAMLHDIVIMTGIMSIMGLVFGWEADALFLTGLLTVVGYSVQDTIVVFDRIRENAARHRGEPYELIVNRSIMETIQRSLATQLCVLFVLVALFLIGSGAIRQFVGILLIGLLSGTYSSLFTAIPLLVAWEKGELPFVNREAREASAAVRA
jgi:preprotein translocase SecF subunit